MPSSGVQIHLFELFFISDSPPVPGLHIFDISKARLVVALRNGCKLLIAARDRNRPTVLLPSFGRSIRRGR